MTQRAGVVLVPGVRLAWRWSGAGAVSQDRLCLTSQDFFFDVPPSNVIGGAWAVGVHARHVAQPLADFSRRDSVWHG